MYTSPKTSLSSQLLRWYETHGRTLPWRETRDAYRILVSEVMLQQTQVSRVLGFYDRWMETFPNWNELAKATNAEVITMWAGLGYNRRGLMLRDIARSVAKNSEPTTEDGWRILKGIGPYTAAALAVFANHKRTMPVDTNIRRVLGRLLLAKPFSQLDDDERIRRKSIDLMKSSRKFWEIPQALFDLATIVCKKTPSCAECPLRKQCPMAEKFIAGRVRIPKAAIKKAKETIQVGKSHPDRIYRGRILRLVRENPRIKESAVGGRIDPSYNSVNDAQWVRAMIDRMIADGMIERDRSTLHLSKGQ